MKYVAISDAHLGQNGFDGFGYYSLLSSWVENNKIKDLSKTIKDFAGDDPIGLIAVGDILDLSLSYLESALSDFKYLLNDLPKISELIYVVGNHDHHIWTMHCERERVIRPLIKGEMPRKGSIYRPTDNFAEYADFLTIPLNVPTMIAYPVFKLPGHQIYFTHGHLFGGLYTFISDVLSPMMEEKVEHTRAVSTLNISIIEFIYWLLGETGEGIGADGIMEAIYTDSQKGKKSLMYEALKNAVNVLLPNGIIKGFPDSWERAIARWIGKNIINQYVKTPKILSSLDRYNTSENNRKKIIKWAENTNTLSSTIVTGHTHVADHHIDGTEMFNLGGWLITPEDPEPDTNVLLIDEGKMELRKV